MNLNIDLKKIKVKGYAVVIGPDGKIKGEVPDEIKKQLAKEGNLESTK